MIQNLKTRKDLNNEESPFVTDFIANAFIFQFGHKCSLGRKPALERGSVMSFRGC
jgi:hypothetical protein